MNDNQSAELEERRQKLEHRFRKEIFQMLSGRVRAFVVGEVLTPSEVATELKLSKNTVVRHLEAGTLPGVKIGSVWRCSRSRLDYFLATGEVTFAAKPEISSIGDLE